jgi:hypothetical protein
VFRQFSDHPDICADAFDTSSFGPFRFSCSRKSYGAFNILSQDSNSTCFLIDFPFVIIKSRLTTDSRIQAARMNARLIKCALLLLTRRTRPVVSLFAIRPTFDTQASEDIAEQGMHSGLQMGRKCVALRESTCRRNCCSDNSEALDEDNDCPRHSAIGRCCNVGAISIRHKPGHIRGMYRRGTS